MKVNTILLCNENEYRRICVHDILFVSICDYLSTFHLVNRQKINCSKSLTEIAILLPDHFFRISRSHLINLNEVQSVKPHIKTVKLSDSTELKVSCRKTALLKDALARGNHTFTK